MQSVWSRPSAPRVLCAELFSLQALTNTCCRLRQARIRRNRGIHLSNVLFATRNKLWKGNSASEFTLTSASSSFRLLVTEFGTAMQKSPAALAALIPLGESSIAAASEADMFSLRSTSRYGAGSGLCAAVSSRQTRKSKLFKSPRRER